MSAEPSKYSTNAQADYIIPAADIDQVHPEKVGEWVAEETAIVQINIAMQALERAGSIQDMVALRDKARALEVFVSAQGFRDAAQVAKVFQLRAERKAGAWLAENIDHEGGRPKSRGTQQGKQGHDGIVLDDIDISPKDSSRWQLEASLPADRFDEWVAECLAHSWELSAAGLRKMAENHNGKVTYTPDLPDIGALKRIFRRWWPDDKTPGYARAYELVAELSALLMERVSAKD